MYHARPVPAWRVSASQDALKFADAISANCAEAPKLGRAAGAASLLGGDGPRCRKLGPPSEAPASVIKIHPRWKIFRPLLTGEPILTSSGTPAPAYVRQPSAYVAGGFSVTRRRGPTTPTEGGVLAGSSFFGREGSLPSMRPTLERRAHLSVRISVGAR